MGIMVIIVKMLPLAQQGQMEYNVWMEEFQQDQFLQVYATVNALEFIQGLIVVQPHA
jgi:hypothetical protein